MDFRRSAAEANDRHARRPIDDAYHAAVLAGIMVAARDAGPGLVYFAGGILRSPLRSSTMRKAVYDLVGPEALDGLVVMGALGNTVSAEGLARLRDRYSPLPIVTIEVPLDARRRRNASCVGGSARGGNKWPERRRDWHLGIKSGN